MDNESLEQREEMFWIEVDRIIEDKYPNISKDTIRKWVTIRKYVNIKRATELDQYPILNTSVDIAFRRYLAEFLEE